jgi:hypothetical protein
MALLIRRVTSMIMRWSRMSFPSSEQMRSARSQLISGWPFLSSRRSHWRGSLRLKLTTEQSSVGWALL